MKYKHKVEGVDFDGNDEKLNVLVPGDAFFLDPLDYVGRDNISVEGHKGTWYVLSSEYGCYLLEHEQYGEDADAIIVDVNLKVVLDGVKNGWEDYRQYVLNKEEDVEDDKGDAKYVNIRFIKTGLVKIKVPEDFESWDVKQQEKFCDEHLESMSDVHLMSCMCDLRSPTANLKDIAESMFDEAPKVEAIEYDIDEGMNGKATTLWHTFAFGEGKENMLQDLEKGELK